MNSVYTTAATGVSMIEVNTAPVDVWVFQASDGMTGHWAYTACWPTATHGGVPANHRAWCYPQDLHFNLSYKASKYPSLDKTKAIACHEMGHTLGLRHYQVANTCMKDPPTSPASGADYIYKVLLQDDKNHLLGWYDAN